MKIGVIRCDAHSDNCSATGCLTAVCETKATFSDYDDPILVGLDTCGGCFRGKPDRVVERARRLARAGAEAIHLGNCLVGPCPYGDAFSDAIANEGLKVVKGTH